MAVPQRRVFRIERYMSPTGASNNREQPPVASNDSGSSNKEVLATIADLKAEIAELKRAAPDPVVEIKSDPLDGLPEEERPEAEQLRSELKEIYLSIERTKKEIVSLHTNGVNTSGFSRMTDELSAVVDGTENATEAILSAAENIEQLASNLAAAITDESMNNMACDVQDHVVKIFEACNFQDLTGQRVTKVISSFQFIEDRVHHMMEIWGGIDSFADIEPEIPPESEGDKALLNGPALEGDTDVASQDDIDALFD